MMSRFAKRNEDTSLVWVGFLFAAKSLEPPPSRLGAKNISTLVGRRHRRISKQPQLQRRLSVKSSFRPHDAQGAQSHADFALVLLGRLLVEVAVGTLPPSKASENANKDEFLRVW